MVKKTAESLRRDYDMARVAWGSIPDYRKREYAAAERKVYRILAQYEQAVKDEQARRDARSARPDVIAAQAERAAYWKQRAIEKAQAGR